MRRNLLKFLIVLIALALFFFDEIAALHLISLLKPLKPFAKAVSTVINPLFILIVSAVLLAFKKPLFFSHFFSLGIGFGIVRAIKCIVGRSRPDLLLSHDIYTCNFFTLDPHYQSFPSSHALAIMSLATTLSLVYPKYRFWFLGAAFLMSLSRVILQQHFITDVVFGCLIGYFLTQRKIGQEVLARLNI